MYHYLEELPEHMLLGRLQPARAIASLRCICKICVMCCFHPLAKLAILVVLKWCWRDQSACINRDVHKMHRNKHEVSHAQNSGPCGI